MTHTSSTIRVPDTSSVPRHIAIILDGNGRWAQKRRLPRVAGHTKGVDAVRKVIQLCVNRGVEYVTLFAFSSENWRRPPDEVSFLMRLFIAVLEREVARMHANDIRVRIVGDLSQFEPRIQELARRAEAKTGQNKGLTLTIAANYGGRWDIMQAMRRIAEESVAAGSVGPIDESVVEQYLSMSYAPEPDLFIRTGGEQRVSNFLLWQLAYTELYFTDQYWPDFNEASLDAAFASYRQRERRFGRTSAQLNGEASEQKSGDRQQGDDKQGGQKQGVDSLPC